MDSKQPTRSQPLRTDFAPFAAVRSCPATSFAPCSTPLTRAVVEFGPHKCIKFFSDKRLELISNPAFVVVKTTRYGGVHTTVVAKALATGRSQPVFPYWWLTAVVLLLSAGQAWAGPPKVEYLFPAGGARGGATEFTANGSFERWPAQGWCDRPNVKVTGLEKKGTFRVEIPADASPGVAWLRFYDEEGSSSPRPFLIGEFPEIAETEPNNAPREMPVVQLPTAINGRLQKDGDVDGVTVKLKAGETLTAAMQANSLLGSPMDAIVSICQVVERPEEFADNVLYRELFTLEQNHDELGLDPVAVFKAEHDGDYVVRVFAYPSMPDSSIRFHGAENCVYRLTLTTGSYDHSHVLPPRSTPYQIVDAPPSDVPLALTLPATIRGQIATPTAEQVFSFAARKGQKLSLQSSARSIGLKTRLRMQIDDEQGKSLESAIAIDPAKEAALEFAVPADGNYRLRVRDAFRRGGPRFRYELDVASQADFELKAAADSFVVKADKSLEIPVTIDRGKFEGEIEFKVEGLPLEVTCEPVKSAAKGDSAKAVKIELKAAAGATQQSLPFTIVGRSADGIERRVQFTTSLPLDQPHDSFWLTVRP